MRRTSTDKQINRTQKRAKSLPRKRAIQLAASALAVTASLAGASAIADNKGHDHRHYDRSHHSNSTYHQNRYEDRYRHGPVYYNQQHKVRVQIPIRDHGPETLPLGRLITQNSNIDLNRYRLVAVVTKNGRFSNGYASLRTGNSKTERYFLGSRDKTRIPAPSRADRKWRLRLGPGTQVRSLTAVLEPRHNRGYGKPASHRDVSHHDWSYNRSHATTQGTPWLGLAWMLANADDDDRHHDRQQAKRVKKLRAKQARTKAELAETQRQLDRSRERNKRLKGQRSRLAEELAHERVETRPTKRGKVDDDRRKARKGKGATEREVKRTVRYVVSAK